MNTPKSKDSFKASADSTSQNGRKMKLGLTKNIVEKFWFGVCDVMVEGTTENPDNKRMETAWVLKYEGVKCKRVYKNSPVSVMNDLRNTAEQRIELLISKEFDIPAGSKIIYTEDGITTEYKRTGEAQSYPSYHQQIYLEIPERTI